MARQPSDHLPDSLDRLRRVPFVTDLQYAPARDRSGAGYDATLKIKTPRGAFRLLVEAKRSYFSRSAMDRLVPWLNHLRREYAQGIILLARHIPRPAAERLIEVNVNFADDAGNVHLELGDRYNWTIMGMPAQGPVSERRPASPAQLQLLFQFVTYPDSVNWPVRRLEQAAGISKSRAAQARRQMVAEGLIVRAGKQYRLGPAGLLADRLVLGYGQVLRPKLILGTFRPAEKSAESFLNRLRKELPPGIRYSVTGGPAAGLLQRFYRGEEVPLFIAPPARAVARQLRLLPDREGPVTLLSAFGELVFWQERHYHTLAPPWLIYAELLNSSDPRAQEAAEEFRKEFLS